MLEKEGYPFKSKRHAEAVGAFWQSRPEWTIKYYNGEYKYTSEQCPKKLKYQFEQGLPFKVSDKCCDRLKKEPLHKWQDENGKPYGIIGLMREEGGRRENAKCLAFKGKKMNFQPLVVVTKEWEDWFIDKYDVDIADIYKPPYNFERTGCKACPFGIELQQELDILQQYFPNERKQCEAIWKPVYDEYRRLGYRLRKDDGQMRLTDMFDMSEAEDRDG